MFSIYIQDTPKDGVADIYKNGKNNLKLIYANGYFSNIYRVVNPHFSKTIGNAGELTFTMLPPDKLYDKATRDELDKNPLITPIRTYVYIYDSNLPKEKDANGVVTKSQCFWRGRVASISEDFYGNKNVTCEGELSFINDVIFPPHSYGYNLPDNDPVMTRKFHKQNPYDMFRCFTRYYNRHVTKDMKCSWKTFWYRDNSIMDPHNEDGTRILNTDQNTLYKYEQAIYDTWSGKYGNDDTRKYLQALAGLDYELVQDLININETLAPWMPGYIPITANDICRKMADTALSTEYTPLMDVYMEHLATGTEPNGYFEFDYGAYEEINDYGYATEGYTPSGEYKNVDFFPRLNYLKYDDISRKVDQTIVLGNNLLNLDTDLDTTNVYTVVTPLGAPRQRFRCRCHTGFGSHEHLKQPGDDPDNLYNTRQICMLIYADPESDVEEELKRHMRWYHPNLSYTFKTDDGKSKTKTINNMTEEELSGVWSDIKEAYLVDEGTERLHIGSVNPDGQQYIPAAVDWENDKLVKRYGLKGKIVEFDEVTDPYKLMCLGVKYREHSALIDSITISAIDLKTIGMDVDPIRLGYSVRILSPIHGLDSYVQCTAVDLDFDNMANSAYTFGKAISGISEQQVKTNRRTLKG